MLRLKYKLFSFGEKDKSTHVEIDRTAFERYIKSQSFKDQLSKGRIAGTTSHFLRDTYEKESDEYRSVNTQFDWILAHHAIANILEDIDIVQDDVIVTLLIPDTKEGIEVQKLMGAGVEMDISMSTYMDPDYSNGKFIIRMFNGIDFTSSGRMNTPLIEKTKVA